MRNRWINHQKWNRVLKPLHWEQSLKQSGRFLHLAPVLRKRDVILACHNLFVAHVHYRMNVIHKCLSSSSTKQIENACRCSKNEPFVAEFFYFHIYLFTCNFPFFKVWDVWKKKDVWRALEQKSIPWLEATKSFRAMFSLPECGH